MGRKISAYPSGAPLVGGDQIVIARAGNNFRGTLNELFSAFFQNLNHTLQCPTNNSGVSLPASTRVYYGASVPSATAAINRIYFETGVIVTGVRLATLTLGTLSSGQAGSAYLRVNDTTDNLISNNVTFGAVGPTRLDNMAMNVVVPSGQFVEIALDTPAWGTLPTSAVLIAGIAYRFA